MHKLNENVGPENCTIPNYDVTIDRLKCDFSGAISPSTCFNSKQKARVRFSGRSEVKHFPIARSQHTQVVKLRRLTGGTLTNRGTTVGYEVGKYKLLGESHFGLRTAGVIDHSCPNHEITEKTKTNKQQSEK